MTAGRAESTTLATLRKFLLASLAIGIVGTAGELVLLGHVESPAQWIPIMALGVAVLVLVWHAAAPTRATVRTLRLLMLVFVGSGIAGVGLHYDGNVEFERELHPKDEGLLFLQHTVAGATPVLAPGSMVLLGLLGFAHAYRHPAADSANGQEMV